jgi:hypothetical protein
VRTHLSASKQFTAAILATGAMIGIGFAMSRPPVASPTVLTSQATASRRSAALATLDRAANRINTQLAFTPALSVSRAQVGPSAITLKLSGAVQLFATKTSTGRVEAAA